MISSSNLKDGCAFCLSLPLQRKHLFSILFKSLSKELQRLSSKCDQQFPESEGNAFRQLLRVIFGQSSMEFENQCDHSRYYQYFINRLKCSEQMLQFICGRLIAELAEKNYHLELLALQVKNAAESIAAGRVEVQDARRDAGEGLGRVRRVKSKKNRERESQLKIQIKIEGEQGQEGTIPTASIVNSMSYIPIYNSEFSIMDPPQAVSLNNINNLGYFYPYPVYYSQQNQ